MKDDPDKLISVVVPAYNAEKYLSRCIESILAQTHRNLEIIAVNDCSTDDTGRILDDFAADDDRLRVVHNPENRGVHGTRSIGLEQAHGQFVGFVDCDDWIAPGMYADLLDALLHADADVAMCGAACATGPDSISGPKVRFSKRIVEEDSLLERFCDIAFGSGVLWNKLYRAELVQRWGKIPLEREVDAAEDYIVNLGVFAEARRVVALPGFDYFYFEHPESASRRDSNARGFARVLRAYVVALETYAKRFPNSVGPIDRLYTHQLSLPAYHISDPSDFDPFAADLEESMVRLVKAHPAGIHSLVHAFDPAAKRRDPGLRGFAKRFRSACRTFKQSIS